MKLLAILLALVVLSLVQLSHQHVQQDISGELEPYPDYENPLKTAVDDEVKNLPGLTDAIDFRHYSGYLQAGINDKKFIHYWFVESSHDPANDPVILWLNGGPGCSSMEGLFAELGPFDINADGKTLKLRQYSWNKVANVLFMESPTGVGYSYSKSIIEVHTDDSTADENHLALSSFFKKFPQYKNNPLYLSGESYAGVYLPTLGVLVDQDPELNLKGIAIGNGYLDAAKLADSLVFFTYYHGLIGKSTWDSVSKTCCNGLPPTRENCIMSGKNSTYRCKITLMEVSSALSGINPYNLYGDCLKPSKSNSLENSNHESHISRDMVDKALLKYALNPATHKTNQPFHVLDTKREKLGVDPPCTDEHSLVNYLNREEVRNAIHIPKKLGRWDICSALIYIMGYPTRPGGLAPQIKQLIASKRKLKLLVYNGDVDAVCNFLGDEWFVDDLGRKVIKEYSNWKVGKQVAGYVKHYDGIVFATVRGSGHMVPQDRPREAFEMIKAFLGLTGNMTISF